MLHSALMTRCPIATGDNAIQRLPVVILFPHSRCNCKCQMCDIWQIKHADEISIDQVQDWLPEWRALHVEEVVLSGGEPLMYSDFPALCRTIKQMDCRLTVLSSGLLVKRHASTLAEFCDELIVSLDGPEAVHNQIRGLPRAYSLMREGIAGLRQLTSFPIRARCTVQSANIPYLRETVQAALELKLDSISFLATDISSQAFNRSGGWDSTQQSRFIPSDDEVNVLARELDLMAVEFHNEFEQGFIVERSDKLDRKLVQYFRAIRGEGRFPDVRCNAPWVSAVIDAKGRVAPCFFHETYDSPSSEASFREQLNNDSARAWRGELDTTTNETCSRCVCSLFRATR